VRQGKRTAKSALSADLNNPQASWVGVLRVWRMREAEKAAPAL
jgi:hypothetical protein